MPSNVKNRTIKKYTTQTNSHKGYTIEELRRLFGKDKEITKENLRQLIDHSFNYELVSGEGIRITELKNNNFKDNTTKTYKIECTCEGGGGEGSGSGSGGSGSGCDIDANKGVTFGDNEVAPDNTIIADLYDYTLGPSIDTTGVYPVSLSDEGKLIVDMSTSTLTPSVTAPGVMEFADRDNENHFKYKIQISGNKIVASKITRTLKENKTIISTEVYGPDSPKVTALNKDKRVEWNESCSCRFNENNPDNSILRTAEIKVEYTLKGDPKTTQPVSASTRFVHAIYYGYTCAYTSGNPSEIYPGRVNNGQPCFKVYTPNAALKDEEGRRTGITLKLIDSINYVTIRNTENDNLYNLGGYDSETSEEQYTRFKIYDCTARTFNIQDFPPITISRWSWIILLPECFGKFKNVLADYDDTGVYYEQIDGLIKEKILITNEKYGNDPVNLKYTAYTLEDPLAVTLSKGLKMKLTTESI